MKEYHTEIVTTSIVNDKLGERINTLAHAGWEYKDIIFMKEANEANRDSIKEYIFLLLLEK